MKSTKQIWIIGMTVFCLLFTHELFAQENIKKELPTGKVNKKIDDIKKAKPAKTKKVGYIYVKEGKNLLIGNPCAEAVTHDMGFEYSFEDRPDISFGVFWKRLFHNTGVKTKLIFTRGPWWKATVNKKFKKCALQSGDYRG